MATLGSGNFSTPLPALTVLPVWGSADAASSLPAITQSAAGGLIWGASITLPKLKPTTSEQGGFNASVALPRLEGAAEGISGGTGSADSIAYRLVSNAFGEAPSFADSELPILTSAGIGYAAITFSPDVTLPLIQMSAAAFEILTETFGVWVMDAKTKGVSQYTGFNYNSFGARDGINFGANENGIYRLDAETDAGTDIDAQILFAPTGFFYEGADFGLTAEEATKIKRMASVYLFMRSDEDLKVLVKVDEDKYREYAVDTSQDPAGMHNRRIVPGRNLAGVLWQLGVANSSGADFELAAIKAYPIVTSRRV